MTPAEMLQRDRTQSEQQQNPPAVFGACPLPIFEHPQIVLGHGSGGKLTAELIDKVFQPLPQPRAGAHGRPGAA